MAQVFSYIKEGFGGKLGETLAWINTIASIFVGMIITTMIATSAGAYAVSAIKIFTGITVDLTIIVAVLILIAFALNYIGVAEAIGAGDIMTGMELSMVIILIIIGFAFPTRTPDYFAPFSIGNLALALALAKSAYSGYATPTNYIEEAKDPIRTIPRSVIGSVIVTLFGYVLAVIAMIKMCPPSVLAFTPNPFVVATTPVLGGLATLYFAIFGTFAAYNGVIFGMGARARLLTGMSNEGFLPKIVGRISKRGVPDVSLALFTAILLVGTFFGGYLGFVWLVKASAVVGMFNMLFVPAALIVHHLRKETKDMERPWKCPLTIGNVPLHAVIVLAFGIFVLAYVNPADLIPTALCYGLAVLLYIVWLIRGKTASKKG
jgi:amino acid transporter